MRNIFFSLFFLIQCFNFCHSKSLPTKINNLLKSNNVEENAIILNINSEECSSCNANFFIYVNNIYSTVKGSFYVITPNENEKERIHFQLNEQGININLANIISNKELNYFFLKEKSYLIKREGNSYD